MKNVNYAIKRETFNAFQEARYSSKAEKVWHIWSDILVKLPERAREEARVKGFELKAEKSARNCSFLKMEPEDASSNLRKSLMKIGNVIKVAI